MQPLGIGLIGTGYMGKCHALAWNAVAAVFGDVERPRLAVLAEASQELAERKARELGFARATGDWHSLVTDPAVDVVSITTPNAFHPEMAIAALEAGKHVWCEKPMATRLPDAERMLAAARASGKVAALGYNYIQNPIVRLHPRRDSLQSPRVVREMVDRRFDDRSSESSSDLRECFNGAARRRSRHGHGDRHRAMEMAIGKARKSGIGMVAVRNSRHYGMSAYYSMLALPHDMIGVAMTNASRQVVPTFGREARFGTNPMCFAVPAGEELPFVLDMATTTAAAGKLELAARQGKSIPQGWALNERAEATDDPKTAQKARRLLPLGGSREGGSHKGYGLAVLVEILCGVLTGTLTALNADQDPRGHFFAAIRIDTFRPVDEFKHDMDRLILELKATPPVEGQSRVYTAGEIEFETAEERTERGIPLLSSVRKGLREVGGLVGIPYDLE
jgi:LDH2 family malate/lactate/ureidoglycolate dehydrogenase